MAKYYLRPYNILKNFNVIDKTESQEDLKKDLKRENHRILKIPSVLKKEKKIVF